MRADECVMNARLKQRAAIVKRFGPSVKGRETLLSLAGAGAGAGGGWG